MASTIQQIVHPEDCASRGLFPSELVQHSLWWDGPQWLKQSPADWPKQNPLPPSDLPEEERELALQATVADHSPTIPVDRYSSFDRLKRVTAWILRFVNNCRNRSQKKTSPLSIGELKAAERYWIKIIQDTHFLEEIRSKSPYTLLVLFSHFVHSSTRLVSFVSEADGSYQCSVTTQNILSFWPENTL